MLATACFLIHIPIKSKKILQSFHRWVVKFQRCSFWDNDWKQNPPDVHSIHVLRLVSWAKSSQNLGNIPVKNEHPKPSTPIFTQQSLQRPRYFPKASKSPTSSRDKGLECEGPIPEKVTDCDLVVIWRPQSARILVEFGRKWQDRMMNLRQTQQQTIPQTSPFVLGGFKPSPYMAGGIGLPTVMTIGSSQIPQFDEWLLVGNPFLFHDHQKYTNFPSNEKLYINI